MTQTNHPFASNQPLSPPSPSLSPIPSPKGITRNQFLKATSSRSDPGGFFPYQSLDAVGKPEIPLCYCILGLTRGRRFWGLTLLLNHYISDGSTYFRILQRFEELFVEARAELFPGSVGGGGGGTGEKSANPTEKHIWSCFPSTEPKINALHQRFCAERTWGVPNDVELLADMAQTAVRDPNRYSVVKLALTEAQLGAIKKDIIAKATARGEKLGIVSTNDALFEFSCGGLETLSESNKEKQIASVTRIAFPMDFRGRSEELGAKVLGNGTFTVSYAPGNDEDLGKGNTRRPMSAATVRKAIDARSNEPLSWGIFLKNVLKLGVTDRWTENTNSSNPKRNNTANKPGGPLSSLKNIIAKTICPSRLSTSHIHVSWAKVQHMPLVLGDFMCQKPIGLDEDTTLDLRKV